MRIAILSDCYFPTVNGVVTSIRLQIQALRALGHRVDLYCPSYPKPFLDDDSTWRLAAFPFPFHKAEQVALPWPPSVIRRMISQSYDVFHLQTPFSLGQLGLMVSKYGKIPAVFHHHTLWEEYVDYLPVPRNVTRRASIALCCWLANRCKGVVSPSLKVKERFEAQGVVTNISVIPTGISVSDFQNGALRPEYQEGEEVCLYMGRMAFEKSLDVVVRVFKMIYTSRPQARLWMVGDGPARASLEKQVASAGLGSAVRFFGFVDRGALKDFVASAKLFLFSSLTETQGLVLLEAQAGGVPVVAVRASGVDEAVDAESTGFLLAAGDEPAMALAALRLLENDVLYRDFSEKARAWAAKFSLEEMGRALVQTYQNALGRA